MRAPGGLPALVCVTVAPGVQGVSPGSGLPPPALPRCVGSGGVWLLDSSLTPSSVMFVAVVQVWVGAGLWV